MISPEMAKDVVELFMNNKDRKLQKVEIKQLLNNIEVLSLNYSSSSTANDDSGYREIQIELTTVMALLRFALVTVSEASELIV